MSLDVSSAQHCRLSVTVPVPREATHDSRERERDEGRRMKSGSSDVKKVGNEEE